MYKQRRFLIALATIFLREELYIRIYKTCCETFKYNMKQRSSFAITTLILETIAKSEPTGITKTKIMQNVMLNYKRVNRYCVQMIESGLIRRDPEIHVFHITEKGKLTLRNCDELAQFMSPINELINKYRFAEPYYSPSSPDLIRTKTTG